MIFFQSISRFIRNVLRVAVFIDVSNSNIDTTVKLGKFTIIFTVQILIELGQPGDDVKKRNMRMIQKCRRPR